jgi:hypothetical protein
MIFPHSFHTLCRPLSALVLLALLCAGLVSCADPKQGPPLPPAKVGVAGFSQPQSTHDLLAGFLPEDTPLVDSKALPHLDELFSDVLREKTDRAYVAGQSYQLCKNAGLNAAGQRGPALTRWVAVGKCMKADFLLVPHVVEFREREGGDMGVVTPAKVLMDVFLIDVNGAQLISRSHYDETQAALTSNLLDAGKFFSRGGKWVTASALAREGLEKAVKELGL